MKTLVIGANGKIGQHLVRLLADKPQHTVKAMIRKSEQRPFFDELGAEVVVASLEGTVDELQQAMDGCDAVVFTAGSGASTGADKTMTVDLDGAAKAVEAAERVGIERFIMVSAIHADDRSHWTKEMTPYYIAKYHADRILQSSSLDYTIIRPGLLTDDPATGKIAAAGKLDVGSIPREDVAAVIAACLESAELEDKVFELTSGDKQIEDALKNI
ncbi:MAG: SDR family oxidoreductase [Bacillota bacterium]